MRVLALLHGPAAKIGGVEELVGKLLLHRLAIPTRPCVGDQPADAERQAAVRIDLDRYLVVRATDPARLDLETRLHVVERLLEHLERVVARALLDDVEALVQDALGGAALAVAHDRVDELADQRAVIERVGSLFALRNLSSTRHLFRSCRDSGFGVRGPRPPAASRALRVEPRLLLLRSLGAVLRATLLATLDADRVEGAADHVIPDTRQILHTATANQDQRVLLEVVTNTGDVGRDLDPVRQAH